MVVVGKVGCGKSSLLAAITGELDRYKYTMSSIMKNLIHETTLHNYFKDKNVDIDDKFEVFSPVGVEGMCMFRVESRDLDWLSRSRGSSTQQCGTTFFLAETFTAVSIRL